MGVHFGFWYGGEREREPQEDEEEERERERAKISVLSFICSVRLVMRDSGD